MESLTDLQRFRIDENASVLSDASPIIRWKVNLESVMQEHDPTGPAAVIRLNLTIHNHGDNDIAIKARESDDDISDNSPPYPGNFEGTFSDIAGSSLTIKRGTVQSLEVAVTEPYVELYGNGPSQVRIQGHCDAPISIIGINDGRHIS